MYTTKVNVNDLVIDMPLDEANVAQKMESLKTGGLVQPVTVWLQDFRIIDGFHRTEAAKRLGWTEIDCVVKDCNEETFWDARIQSARQHHKITNERFIAWINEAWKATNWGNAQFADSAKKALWNIKKIDPHFFGDKEYPEAEKEIFDWLVSKSLLWSINTHKLYDILMWYQKPNMLLLHKYEVEESARKANLDHQKREFLIENTPSHGTGNGKGQISSDLLDDYAVHVATSAAPQKLRDFRQERSEKFQQEALDKLLSMPKPSKEDLERMMRQEMRKSLTDALNVLKATVRQNPDVLSQLDDGYEMLMSLSAWAATKAAELFPEREQPTEIQLRRELADAYKQIQSLQKALDSRKSYRPNLPEVMAYSSTEIAKAG